MYIGLDVHKEFIQVATLKDASSEVEESFRIDATVKAIVKFARTLGKKDNVVLECTTHSYPIASLLRKHGANVVISNPIQTKLIAKSRTKTDKIDAEKLARLCASGHLPTIWQPPDEIIAKRKLMTYLGGLVSQRIIVKNRVHAILHRNLIDYRDRLSLFNGVGMEYLNEIKESLPLNEKFQIELELKLLESFEDILKRTKKKIAQIVMEDEEAKRLMTIPGVDYLTAFTLMAVIGDITRFKSPKKLVSYFGLFPSVYQSGKSATTGRITKSGSIYARYALVQSSKQVARMDGPLQAFFDRLAKKKQKNKATIAVASKLTRIVWKMLTKKEDYYFPYPLMVKEKMARLRIIATGKRLKAGKKINADGISGRQRYLEARKHDHDDAIKAEQNYIDFVANRMVSEKSAKSA